MTNISALILAAGYSSRMKKFKPLLPLGKITVLNRVINLFQDAGLEDIKVVTGHRAKEVTQEAARLGIETAFNAQYAQGMFSSILTGIKALSPSSEAFFVLPVDIPLVTTSTVELLLNSWQKQPAMITYPVFEAERGHPPLISTQAKKHILSWSGQYGLRGALETLESQAVEITTSDKYILLDMDHPHDYEHILHCQAELMTNNI